MGRGCGEVGMDDNKRLPSSNISIIMPLRLTTDETLRRSEGVMVMADILGREVDRAWETRGRKRERKERERGARKGQERG